MVVIRVVVIRVWSSSLECGGHWSVVVIRVVVIRVVIIRVWWSLECWSLEWWSLEYGGH